MTTNEPPLIEYANVSVRRGDNLAVNGITFSIRFGEQVAILGPNGSGKSTVIKTINREIYPQLGGSLRIMGQERWNVFDLRPMLGMVSNDLADACKRDFTAREVVLSGFFSSVGVWPHHHVTPAMQARTDEVLSQLEIGHLAGRWMDELSSGEQKRALIGRALVHRPRALLLDEPTNSLDLRAMYELREIMRQLVAGGITLILVTHHLPDIIPEIERVIVLKNGQVFRDGPKREVLSEQTLAEVFGIPIEIEQRDGYFHMW